MRQDLTKVAAEERGAKAPDVVQRDVLGGAQEARQAERAVRGARVQRCLDHNRQRLRQRPVRKNSSRCTSALESSAQHSPLCTSALEESSCSHKHAESFLQRLRTV